MQREFNSLSFGVRWLAALVLVLATYNPYAMSYYHWLIADGGYASLKVLAGVALLILHIVTMIATWRSMGAIGVGLVTALAASAAWFLIDSDVLDIENPRKLGVTVLVILGTVYGVGLSYSHIRNRLAGQVDSRDVTSLSPI
jgi:hypothetical protein